MYLPISWATTGLIGAINQSLSAMSRMEAQSTTFGASIVNATLKSVAPIAGAVGSVLVASKALSGVGYHGVCRAYVAGGGKIAATALNLGAAHDSTGLLQIDDERSELVCEGAIVVDCSAKPTGMSQLVVKDAKASACQLKIQLTGKVVLLGGKLTVDDLEFNEGQLRVAEKATVTINNHANLAGKLVVMLEGGEVVEGKRIHIMTYTSHNGQFGTIEYQPPARLEPQNTNRGLDVILHSP